MCHQLHNVRPRLSYKTTFYLLYIYPFVLPYLTLPILPSHLPSWLIRIARVPQITLGQSTPFVRGMSVGGHPSSKQIGVPCPQHLSTHRCSIVHRWDHGRPVNHHSSASIKTAAVKKQQRSGRNEVDRLLSGRPDSIGPDSIFLARRLPNEREIAYYARPKRW